MSKFQEGLSGNPKGRPKGIADKRSYYRQLLNEHSEALVNKMVDLALQGDSHALRLCIERLIPRVKDEESPFLINDPNLENIKNVIVLGGQIIESVGKGEITPEQGRTITSMLETQSRLIETSQLSSRIDALEHVLKRRNKNETR